MVVGRFIQRLVGGCHDLFNQAVRQRLRGLAVLDIQQIFNVALGSLDGRKIHLAALEGLGLVNSVSNIDNEIEILRSKTLVKHVVSELNLYTTYSVKGSFNEVELYKSSVELFRRVSSTSACRKKYISCASI